MRKALPLLACQAEFARSPINLPCKFGAIRSGQTRTDLLHTVPMSAHAMAASGDVDLVKYIKARRRVGGRPCELNGNDLGSGIRLADSLETVKRHRLSAALPALTGIPA